MATDSSGMLMPATGEPCAVGDLFVVHMDREGLNDYPLGRYDVTVIITDFDPNRQVAWTVHGQIRPTTGRPPIRCGRGPPDHTRHPRSDGARRLGYPG